MLKKYNILTLFTFDLLLLAVALINDTEEEEVIIFEPTVVEHVPTKYEIIQETSALYLSLHDWHFDFDESAIDMQTILQNKGINSILIYGRTDLTKETVLQADHVWLLAETES